MTTAAALTLGEALPSFDDLARLIEEAPPQLHDQVRALMICAPVKNKSYRATPIGQEVARYIRSLRWAEHPETTLDSYERVLARLSNDHAHYTLERFLAPDGTELLRNFLSRHWAESAPATKAHHLSVVKSFLEWEVGEERIAFNPAARIRAPKGSGRVRRAYPVPVLRRLVSAQETLRDQVCCELLAMLGLRKMELGNLRVGDVDLARNEITVHGKGGKAQILPLGFKRLREDLYLLIQGESLAPSEYLLHPKRDRFRPMDPSSVHRWFERCCERAGLAGIEMHELRHSAADLLWRQTGDLVKAQKLLRHKSVATTQDYLHPLQEDVRDAMVVTEAAWDAAE